MSIDLYSELEWRGLIHQVTDPDLPKILAEQSLTIYCGFDPTAASLTVGHLLQMLRMRRFQLAGHRPIVVAGGGTGLIGDPSGKESERPMLSRDEIGANIEGFRKQMEGLLDFSVGESQAMLLNNADWLVGIDLIDFLRDVGKHFSVNMMIAKESVKARLNEREQGISYTEFSYMLLQSYDFLWLYDNYGCRIQTSGSDQWGNITAGIELIRKTRGAETYGLTSPLITLPDGKAMSKTAGNAIWLDPKLTSPYQFYQYWFNSSDAQVGQLLRFFTFLDQATIKELEDKVQTEPATRSAQKALAREVTTLVHGEAEAVNAERASRALFGSEIAELDEGTLLEVLSEAPATKLSRTELEQGKPLVDLLVEAKMSNSKAAARTDIGGGGIYLNNVRSEDVEKRLGRQDLLHDRYVVIRRGKRTYHLISFE